MTGTSFKIREGSADVGEFGTYGSSDWFAIQISKTGKMQYVHEGQVIHESTTDPSSSLGVHVVLNGASKVCVCGSVSGSVSGNVSGSVCMVVCDSNSDSAKYRKSVSMHT